MCFNDFYVFPPFITLGVLPRWPRSSQNVLLVLLEKTLKPLRPRMYFKQEGPGLLASNCMLYNSQLELEMLDFFVLLFVSLCIN